MSSTRNMRDVNKNNQPTSAAQAPRLPALPINKLTQGQLKAVVPGLMQLATNSSPNKDNSKTSDLWTANYSSLAPSPAQNNCKENITTDLLRLMVRNCYRHLGQEELLTDNNNINWKSALATLSQLQSNGLKKGSRLGLDILPDILSTQGYNKSFIEIYLCFFCSEEFGGKEELRLHQNQCSFRPPELRSIRSPSKSPATESSACPQLSPLLPTDTGVVISHSREDYMQGLDLLPVQKAIRIREKRKNTEIDLDVDKFAEPVTPKSPGTPRTPKSLISQLSRDGESSACKRRLSYLCPRDNSDAESVISNSSSDDEPQKPSKTLSLLFIDVASPLGQKVQKCMASEPVVHTKVLTNAESFCRTPVKDSSFSEKLRVRNASIPVTFKLTRKRIRQFNHTYKFTKSERELSYDYIRTGLNKGSRMLKKSLPRCKVPLKRLAMNDFKHWKANPNPPKVPLNWRALQRKTFQLLQKQKQMSSNQPCSFPNGLPVLLGPGIDRLLGLRKKEEPIGKKSSLTLTNVLSEDANAEMSQLKLSLYKSLLTELSDYQQKFQKTKSPNLQIPNLQAKSTNHQMTNLQLKHFSSPIKDQLNQKAAPVFLSPCRVSIQQLERDQEYLPPPSLSPPSSTHSAKTKPLSIDIPKDNFKPSSGSTHKSRRDLYNDIDNLTSDDSISIRTGSSDESYKCLSPEEEPCVKCERYLCKCKSKALKSKDKDSPKKSFIGDKTPVKIKKKIGRPRKDSKINNSLSAKKNANLGNKKKDCSKEIIKKYRRKFPAKKLNYSLRGVDDKPVPAVKIPKCLQIDMKESAFIPAVMLGKVAVPKKLAIDMEWKPLDSKCNLRQRNSVDGKLTDAEATTKLSKPGKGESSTSGIDTSSDDDDTPLSAICQRVTEGKNIPIREKEPGRMSPKEHSEDKSRAVNILKKSPVKQIIKDLKNVKEKDAPKVAQQSTETLTSPRDKLDIASYIRPKILMRKHPNIGNTKSQTVMSPPLTKPNSISPEEPAKKKLKMPKGLEINMVWQPEDLPARRESKPKPDELQKSESESGSMLRERSASVTVLKKLDDSPLRQRSLSISQGLAKYFGKIVEVSPSSLKKSATLPGNSPMKWVRNTNLHFHPGGDSMSPLLTKSPEKQKSKSSDANATIVNVSPCKTSAVHKSPVNKHSSSILKLPLSVNPIKSPNVKDKLESESKKSGSPKKASSCSQGGIKIKNSSRSSSPVKQNKSVLPIKIIECSSAKKTPGSSGKVQKSILGTPSGSPSKKVTDKSLKKSLESSSSKKSMSENTAPTSPKKTQTTPRKVEGSPSKKNSNTSPVKSSSPKKDSPKKSKSVLMPSKNKKLSIQSYQDFLMEVQKSSTKSQKSPPKSAKTSPKMNKSTLKKSPFGSKILMKKKEKSKSEDKRASLTAASLLAGARGTKRKISLGKTSKTKKPKTKE
ncbi:hypothetical protein LOTGIDRAFT_173569 [Lottia gigantea]|uniref:Uncharacterized protein n=1 Tax=Lottia gigantea TaxID=225164 RepID=V4B0N1_LOTGI|nr:hypothetical protein LOTGIDRAFT_173569 [Lottia gigantea]ESO99731.1 hypothetical protein LOTGIDRAFT_173569 [Lottia gigantea]